MVFVLEKANWAVPKHVHAVTTTVHGGVSEGVYRSLNLGDHVNDDLELVRQNRAIIKKNLDLPNDPVWLKQVHGVGLVRADDFLFKEAEGFLSKKASAEGSLLPVADGSYTFKPGVVCTVMTADCMPIFLSSKEGDRVAIVHAGWRGLADGIIEQGVTALGCDHDQVVAWAGPCIGPDSFEIGDEVRQQLGGADSAYRASGNSTVTKLKWFANLYQLAGERLADIGVDNYHHSDVCTFKDKDYFSYRRTGQCGRMASFIWIDHK